MLLLLQGYVPSGGSNWARWEAFEFPIDSRRIEEEEFLILLLTMELSYEW